MLEVAPVDLDAAEAHVSESGGSPLSAKLPEQVRLEPQGFTQTQLRSELDRLREDIGKMFQSKLSLPSALVSGASDDVGLSSLVKEELRVLITETLLEMEQDDDEEESTFVHSSEKSSGSVREGTESAGPSQYRWQSPLGFKSNPGIINEALSKSSRLTASTGVERSTSDSLLAKGKMSQVGGVGRTSAVDNKASGSARASASQSIRATFSQASLSSGASTIRDSSVERARSLIPDSQKIEVSEATMNGAAGKKSELSGILPAASVTNVIRVTSHCSLPEAPNVVNSAWISEEKDEDLAQVETPPRDSLCVLPATLPIKQADASAASTNSITTTSLATATANDVSGTDGEALERMSSLNSMKGHGPGRGSLHTAGGTPHDHKPHLVRDNVFIQKAISGSDPEHDDHHMHDIHHDPSTWLARMVDCVAFDISVGVMIAMNGAWIGFQTDWVAQQGPEATIPGHFATVDTVFCIIFTVEVGLRLYLDRILFFVASGWQWNVFDFVLVMMQIIEEISSRASSGSNSANLSFLRILRILRLIRVIRLVRIVRMIGELRTIVSSILGSLKALAWTVVLLLLLIYLVAIYFTQLVADNAYDHPELQKYYGSLGRSVLALFEAFTGGVDWDDMATPLTDIHPACSVLFALYIAFAVLAMMNVVTGVFVETALCNARHDKDTDLVNLLREVFTKSDEDMSGTMSWEEFKTHIEDPQMDTVFKAIDLDRSEAKGLFELIDVGDAGEIGREEFIMGCLRLQGPAKALDLATLMYDNKRLAYFLQSFLEEIKAQMHKFEVQQKKKKGVGRNSRNPTVFRTTLAIHSEREEGYASSEGPSLRLAVP